MKTSDLVQKITVFLGRKCRWLFCAASAPDNSNLNFVAGQTVPNVVVTKLAPDGSVAIYAGHDRIIHATASGGGVRYDVLGEGERGEWFTDHIVTARRIVAEGRARPNVRRDDSRDEGELDPPDQAPRSSRSRGE